MKNYPHLMGRIFNTPLMIQPAKARAIVSALSQRLGVITEPRIELPADVLGVVPGALPYRETGKPYVVTDRGVAVISACGTLAHNAATAAPPSGMTTYDEIHTGLEDAVTDPRIRGVLFDISSPGGEASESAFGLAEQIREMRQIKPIWAVADEMACSAAYLLASGASKFFCPELGYCGSIGVYALHLDESGYDKKEGLVWNYIFAGEHKVDGNPHEPLSDDVRQELQEDVDATYARFIDAVALGRSSLGSKGARATQARYYRGTDAVRIGLADDVLDFRAALEQLTAALDRPAGQIGSARMSARLRSAPNSQVNEDQRAASAARQPGEEKETEMSDPTKPGAQAPAPAAEKTAAVTPSALAADAAPAAANVVDLAAARGEGFAAAQEIVELCTLAGVPAKAAEFIAAKASAADVRKALANLRASNDAGAGISSAILPSAGAGAGAGAKPGIVKACEALAASSSKRKGA